MAWIFGDGFDLYATTADALAGYWDSGTTNAFGFNPGRFTGGQCVYTNQSLVMMVKSSGVNDAVHHFTLGYKQSATIGGTTNNGLYFTLFDGATAQCSIVFRADGVILLASGSSGGSVLAAWNLAVTAANVWYAFEFEVVIHNTAGSFAIRRNGNTVNDFSATSLDTQVSANAYANKLQVGSQFLVANQFYDDFLWRSDASSVAWTGDLRCYTRMPASDASVQFSRSPTSTILTQPAPSSTGGIPAATANYTAFTTAYDGAVGTVTLSLVTGYTGNMKCSLFSSSGVVPLVVLGSATPVTNPITGVNTFTFGTPVAVARGTQYWVGFDSDTAAGTWSFGSAGSGRNNAQSYAGFPVSNPVTGSGNGVICSVTVTVAGNFAVVNEAQQDGLTSYVYDATPGDADLYGLTAITPTPVGTVAVITRGLMQKSDVGTRTAAVQVKSGGTTVASPTITLSNSGWLWVSRTDTVDPNTSAAWTAAGVDALQIGPKVIA